MAALVARILSEIPVRALSAYPECTPLYHKLATHLGVGIECLLLTAGSDGAIRSVFETYVNPGDVVIHTQPSFAMYAVYCQMFGATPVTLEYQPSDHGPSLAVESVVQTITEVRPKLVCLPNPDSPTGTVFSPDDLRRIIETAGGARAVVLIDEAYYPFYDWTALPWVEQYGHLVIARTFSKAWGLAGLRLGYAVSCPEVTHLLHKMRPSYEANTLQVTFVERLLDHANVMHDSVRRLNAGRDTFLAEMDALGLRTIHAKGNFLHVAFGERASAVHRVLQDMILYQHESNDLCLKGFTRFSATTVELFRPVIAQIRRVITEAS
jgi:histidinol-phosphate aminotransferase